LDACAFGFGNASGTLRIAPCLRLEGGIVLGTLRSRTVSSGTLGAPWLAPGALLHGRLRFAANWLAEVDAGLLLPLFRRQFLTVGDAYVLSDQRGMTPSERPLAATPPLASALYASVGWAYP
jgi:hypothetical protein